MPTPSTKMKTQILFTNPDNKPKSIAGEKIDVTCFDGYITLDITPNSDTSEGKYQLVYPSHAVFEVQTL